MSSYWDKFTGDQLLDVELETTDPEGAEKLVRELPPDHLDAHVESDYNLPSDHDEVCCVHRNHRHRRGFVMRVRDVRFLVGWKCAKDIYQQEWSAREADFNEAVNRRQARVRRAEIEQALQSLITWLDDVESSRVLDHYEDVRRRLNERMPWIMTHGPAMPAMGYEAPGFAWPKSLFWSVTNPRSRFSEIAAEARSMVSKLQNMSSVEGEIVGRIKKRVDDLFARLMLVVADLDELLTFYQPAILSVICQCASRNDNTQKRRYEAGLSSLTCIRTGAASAVVMLPASYRVPDGARLAAIREEILKL